MLRSVFAALVLAAPASAAPPPGPAAAAPLPPGALARYGPYQADVWKTWFEPDGRVVGLTRADELLDLACGQRLPLPPDVRDRDGRTERETYRGSGGGWWPVESRSGRVAVRGPEGFGPAVNIGYQLYGARLAVNHDRTLLVAQVDEWGDVEREPRPRTFILFHDLRANRPLFRVEEAEIDYRGLALTPDDRAAVTAHRDGRIVIWETATGKPRATYRCDVPQWYVSVSPDGRTAATCARAGSSLVHVWDLRGAAKRPEGKTWATAWAELGSPDAAVGWRAVGVYAASPADALPALRVAMAARRTPDPARVRALVADLDAPTFAAREAASAELADVIDRVATDLRAVSAPSPEARRRIDALLAKAGEPSPDTLRIVRAVEAVEWVGTADARTLLAEWAAAADPRLKAEAAAALARLRAK